VITNIFGEGANPVGQIIRIKNLPFTVVGTLVAKGQNAAEWIRTIVSSRRIQLFRRS